MKSKLLIISFGPSQLLSQIALIHQLGRLHEVVGVVSYVSDNPRVIEFEKRVCGIFRFDYLGSIEGLREKILEIGFCDIKSIFRRFLRRDLVARLQHWLTSECLSPSSVGCELVISYRKNLVSDNLLLQALQPADVHMVDDGFYMTMDTNLKNRFFSFLFGGGNYFTKKPVSLYIPAYYFGQYNNTGGHEIGLDALKWCYEKISSEFSDLKDSSVPLLSEGPFTLILWQNLYPEFVPDKKTFLDFFKNLLREEAVGNSCQLLVKPHPRSSREEIAELEDACPEEINDRVEILNQESLLAVPVEILLSRFRVSRVAGMASTGIWAVYGLANAEVAIYSNSQFPVRLQKEIQRFADTLDVPVSHI